MNNFRNSAGGGDKIVLVFATERSLNEAEMQVLKDLRAMGTARLGPIFDIETISIELTPNDLRDIENAASKITVQGARYPERLEQMTGR